MQERIEIVAELRNLMDGQFQQINSRIAEMEGNLRRVDSVGGGGSGSGGGGFLRNFVAGNLIANGITRGATALLDFEKGAISAYGNLEQFQTSLTTMFHGNREEADMLIGRLQTFAKETPFALPEIQEATKMMIAYGSTSGGVVNELTMLGNVSSGVGAPLKDIAYLYGTLRTQGRAYGMDIRQFAGRGIPIYEALAKTMHVNKDAINKMVSAGKVGFKEVESAFKSMTGEGGQFAEMMNAQSKTLNGQLSNLSDSWVQLQASIGGAQSGILKSTVSWSTDMVNSINRGFQADAVIDKGFEKYGADKFSTMEKLGKFRDKFASLFGGNYVDGGAAEIQQYASGMHENLVGKSKDKLSTLRNISTISNIIYNIDKDSAMDPQEKARRLAILRELKDEDNAILNSLNKEQKVNGDGSAEQKASDLEKVAKANRPTQINISIENLVREYKNIVNNAKEGMRVTQEDVARALIAAVNDVSTLNFQ